MNLGDIEQEIEAALEQLGLPKLVTKDEIKKQYRKMARAHHPDIAGTDQKMEELNQAYALLIDYIDTFRYRFDEVEITQHYPEGDHAQKFRF
jgi:DnaJ-class molecular chaperone